MKPIPHTLLAPEIGVEAAERLGVAVDDRHVVALAFQAGGYADPTRAAMITTRTDGISLRCVSAEPNV